MTPILLTTGQILSAHARLRPTEISARDLERSLSNLEWNARACRLANALTGLGLAKGDRVAVLAYNRLEWATGLIPVPINFRLTGTEAAFIINDSGAAAVIVEDALLPTLDAARADISIPEDRFILIGGTPRAGYRGYEDLLSAASDTEPQTMVLPDDPWCLMYTSGTTGNPKGAIRSHRGMAMLALMTDIEFHLHRQDDALLVMPMCHANSLNFFTAFLYCGGRITIFSRSSFDPELCLKALG
jgi:fatty-acyl-CoA synthase